MLAFLTVIDLSGRADVSRADMVLACLATRVGMRFLSGGVSGVDADAQKSDTHARPFVR
jgi:hypothetical protein